MESTKISLIFLFTISSLFISSDHLKRPLTEEQVLRFLILESDLSDRFAVPLKFDEHTRVPKYTRRSPIINVYDSLLSFGNFSIDTIHFEAIGLKVDEFIGAIQFPNRIIPDQIASLKSVNMLGSLPDFGPEMGKYVTISRVYVFNFNQAVVATNFACFEGCGYLELLLITRKNKNKIFVQDRLIVNLD